MSLLQGRNCQGTVHRETNTGYISLEAGLGFKDPGQDFTLAPFKSYGLRAANFAVISLPLQFLSDFNRDMMKYHPTHQASLGFGRVKSENKERL